MTPYPNVAEEYEPSEEMVRVAGSYKTAVAHRQDQSVVLLLPNVQRFAIIDAAKNRYGELWEYEFVHEPTAIDRGLPLDTIFNGGTIVSSLVKRLLQNPDLDLHGYGLIAYLNQEIAQLCADLGKKISVDDRSKCFTCYVTLMEIRNDLLKITAIGDCYGAVNEELVCGINKACDVFNAEKVDEIRDFYEIEERRDVYRPYMDTANYWQFALQNNPRGKANWYPAIDGTVTPRQGIQYFEYHISEVRNLMLWTDGLKRKGLLVHGLGDLERDNSEFNEFTFIRAQF